MFDRLKSRFISSRIKWSPWGSNRVLNVCLKVFSMVVRGNCLSNIFFHRQTSRLIALGTGGAPDSPTSSGAVASKWFWPVWQMVIFAPQHSSQMIRGGSKIRRGSKSQSDMTSMGLKRRWDIAVRVNSSPHVAGKLMVSQYTAKLPNFASIFSANSPGKVRK